MKTIAVVFLAVLILVLPLQADIVNIRILEDWMLLPCPPTKKDAAGNKYRMMWVKIVYDNYNETQKPEDVKDIKIEKPEPPEISRISDNMLGVRAFELYDFNSEKIIEVREKLRVLATKLAKNPVDCVNKDGAVHFKNPPLAKYNSTGPGDKNISGSSEDIQDGGGIIWGCAELSTVWDRPPLEETNYLILPLAVVLLVLTAGGIGLYIRYNMKMVEEKKKAEEERIEKEKKGLLVKLFNWIFRRKNFEIDKREKSVV